MNLKPKEYQLLVNKLLNDNHKICKVNGLPTTFYQAIAGVDILSKFDVAYYSFVNDFPYSHHMSQEQLVFTFKILLQQQLDRYWYSGFKYYNTNLEIYNDRYLKHFDCSETLFSYSKLDNGEREISKKRRLYLNLINSPLKNSNGMFLPYAPKPMYNFLNKLCRDLDISIVITNVLRSVEFQHSLIKNGHITPSESSHLYGYAADIEQKWYRENRPELHKKIKAHLDLLEDQGLVNYIDYGHIWHLCLSPSYILKFLK